MRPLTATLNVVTTDDLTTEDIREISQIDDGHVAVVRPRPHRRGRRDAPLQAALFESIGVSNEVSGTGRDVTTDWHHLIVLFADIDDLIVADAHLLTDTKLRSLIELSITTDTSLWLMIHTQHFHADQHAELDAWPTRRVPARRFIRQFQGRQRHERTEAPARGSVRVPRSDFPTFRKDCLDLLHGDDFEAIDLRYSATGEAALAWAATQNELTEDDVADWLRRQFDDCATVDDLQVVIRATQAALFISGWFLKVDIDAFLGANDRVHTPAARSAETWRRLRVYRQTYRRATCALAAAGLSLDQMRTIRVCDVATDGSVVRLDGDDITIEPPARAMLISHLLHQHTMGRRDDDLLLTDDAGKALSDHQLKRAITEPLLEAGVALINGRVVRRTPNPAHWMRRQGISINRL